MKSLVSVFTAAYNQEDIIEDCINGVLCQDLNLVKEYVIADDASTDNTKEIIDKYHKKYPQLIKPIYRKKNVGTRLNTSSSWENCSGKYLAGCAGDDIWIDSKHLTKQIEILENNKQYEFVATNAIEWYLQTNEYKLKDNALNSLVLTPVDYLIAGKMVGSTYVWRNNMSQELIDIYRNHGDTRFFMYLAQEGSGYYNSTDISTIYRVSNSSSFKFNNNSSEKRISNYLGKIYKNEKFNDHTDGQYNIKIKFSNNLLLRKIIKNYLKDGKYFYVLVFFYHYDYNISNSRRNLFFFKTLKWFLSFFDSFLKKSYDKKFNKIKESIEQ